MSAIVQPKQEEKKLCFLLSRSPGNGGMESDRNCVKTRVHGRAFSWVRVCSPETKPIYLLIQPGTFTLPSHSAEIRLSRSKFLQLFFALDSRHVANTVSVTAMPNVTPKGKPVEGRKVEKLSAFIWTKNTFFFFFHGSNHAVNKFTVRRSSKCDIKKGNPLHTTCTVDLFFFVDLKILMSGALKRE